MLTTMARLGLALGCLAALFAFSQSGEAHAALMYRHLASTNGVNVLLIQGQFEPTDDPNVMAHELDSFPTKLVSFLSAGGDRPTAMKFGRTIRGLGLTTLQIKNSSCTATCLLAYLGGVERYAEAGSIAVQASGFLNSSDAGQGVLSAAATAEPIVKQYLSEMGVVPELFDLSQVQSETPRYLSEAEVRQMRVTTDPSISTGRPAEQVQGSMATSEAVETALGFFNQFNAAWSQPKQLAMSFLRNSYADSLTYYGKQLSAAAVLAEKEAFADRWPARIYAIRSGTAHASCSNTCAIFGIVDWYASSLVRQKSSSGAVNFALVWNPTTGKILSETGKIIETDKNPGAPDRIIRRWIVDATNCRLSSQEGPTDAAACQSQNQLGKQLNVAGWCYQAGIGWQYCGGD
ncbi:MULTISPECIES: hypothetical protein [unclassified Rhizobium]|uniref:hypothetical protein n=1 Tax=unclassified Rhizobium TaxID=2613769 RepID=UPI001ADBD41A|nr:MULTISPECIES: hypothetical protein [unclassified Rhizobium]MBO9102187.1 hypothetical protein [Rhizobium sp. L58/93]MBO9172283.1 hypothetical protein [Rhizobium sp. L245/93]MBO9188032.1 hypothetical protein [Rhizobium sp. E27B/91]QXZ86308.1 hypothetical protein J5287_24955 [Rhizobium sp. K1/93]QXZ92237.1 hypothetical protein J5280_24230 [Rhizobium sp. K15/93]